MSGVAQELARMPGVAQRLLAVHLPDGQGRCRACTTPGTGVPGAPWPCALHFYATAAEEIRKQGSRERGSQ
jgi:hypothetical protein